MSIDLAEIRHRRWLAKSNGPDALPARIALIHDDIPTLVAEVERLRRDVREQDGFLHIQDGENLRLAAEVNRLESEMTEAVRLIRFGQNYNTERREWLARHETLAP